MSCECPSLATQSGAYRKTRNTFAVGSLHQVSDDNRSELGSDGSRQPVNACGLRQRDVFTHRHVEHAVKVIDADHVEQERNAVHQATEFLNRVFELHVRKRRAVIQPHQCFCQYDERTISGEFQREAVSESGDSAAQNFDIAESTRLSDLRPEQCARNFIIGHNPFVVAKLNSGGLEVKPAIFC